ncbi:SDR family NAD(P)-dependent oxidoreductase [Paenibacillus sp. TSA_86.1]|uniref:SDR family NAD(P)-dependent oxidoreductase n=1 Tax=Paenibacillus sp. TSA_86.1 TaxID=3415649 RepID=UPI0040467BBC
MTGASKGLGLSLVRKLIKNGYRVAATSRNIEDLKQAVGEVPEGQFLPLAVDLTQAVSIQASVSETYEQFGQIDVAVNNPICGRSVQGISSIFLQLLASLPLWAGVCMRPRSSRLWD